MCRRDVGRVGAVVLAAVLLSRLVLLLAYHPDVSDVSLYERYAAVVAAMAAEKLSLPGGQSNSSQVDGLSAASSSKLLEYPPLAVSFMAAAGIGTTQPTSVYPDAYADRYRLLVFAVELVILVALIAAACLSLADRNASGKTLIRSLVVYGIGGVALAYLLYDRLDLVVGALLLLSLLLLLHGSWRSSFVFLALAVDFKAVPLILAPLWIVGSLPSGPWVRESSRDLRRLARVILGRTLFLVGAAAVFFLPFLVVVGSRALDFVRFNAMRGVQIESIPSSLLLALGVPVRVVYQFEELEVDSAATSLVAGLSPVLVALAALGATAAYALSRARSGQRSKESAGSPAAPTRLVAASDPEGFVAATLLILLSTIVFSKALSPQYLLWILPIVPLLVVGRLHGRLFQVGFLAACFLSTLIYPALYLREFERVDPAGGYLDPGTLGVAVLVLRNGILIVLILLLLRPVVKLNRPRSPGAEVSRQ